MSWNLAKENCYILVNCFWLVVWNIFYCPFHIWDVILPIDFHMFQDGKNHQPGLYYCYFCVAITTQCVFRYPTSSAQEFPKIRCTATGVISCYAQIIPEHLTLIITGWWFGTCCIFPFSWECHHPN